MKKSAWVGIQSVGLIFLDFMLLSMELLPDLVVDGVWQDWDISFIARGVFLLEVSSDNMEE